MTIKHWKAVKPGEWPARYFTPQEIACRGTGMVRLTPDSLDALRRLPRGVPLQLSAIYAWGDNQVSAKSDVFVVE